MAADAREIVSFIALLQSGVGRGVGRAFPKGSCVLMAGDALRCAHVGCLAWGGWRRWLGILQVALLGRTVVALACVFGIGMYGHIRGVADAIAQTLILIV